MERHETLHFSCSPALIKLDVEKVSALSGFHITADLTVGVTEDVHTGKWEPCAFHWNLKWVYFK